MFNKGDDTIAKVEKKDKEKIIMEEAVDSFRTKGIEKTSIRDIMKKTKFGLGTFYLYFKGKKDLEEKIVLDTMVDILYRAEKACVGDLPKERYISFLDNVINFLLEDPMKVDLILKNINWALYAKVENDEKFKDADTALQFILKKHELIFPGEHTQDEKIYLLSLAMHVVLSTCKSSLKKDSVLTIDQMKAVLYKMVEKILARSEI